MTNNELSRKVLAEVKKNGGSAKFTGLVETLAVDARALFKNLFFLEEKGIVQLATRYGSDSVYPQILLVKMRRAGEELLADHEKMDQVFPLSDDTTDVKPHIPPTINDKKVTYSQVLEKMAKRVRKEMEGDEKESALEKIESLLALGFVNDEVKK